MTLATSRLVFCLCVLAGGWARYSSADTTFYVAEDGKDTWTGRMPVVPPRSDDGPLATIGRAVQLARAVRGTNNSMHVTIKLRNGTYFLTEPLRLNGQDSFLTLASYQKETPIISGGRRVTGWQAAQMNSNQVFTADVPWVKNGSNGFRQMWVNNKRAQRARYPDKGYLSVAALPDATPDWEKGHSRIQYATNDVLAWPGITNAEVLVMTRWVESRMPIESLDSTQRIISCSKRSMFQLSPGDKYFLEGAVEFLNEPGEWALDQAAGKVYYKPRAGETASAMEAIVPMLDQVMLIEPAKGSGQHVQNLMFNGLTFSHTEWNFGPWKPGKKHAGEMEPGGFPQAAIGVNASVSAEGLVHSTFDRCRFVNLGNYSLNLGRGCQSNVVKNCLFTDMGAGGIRIGETAIPTNDIAGWILVTNCIIHDGGKMFASGEGIWIGQSPNNQLIHNSIYDFFYTGISIGWTWGYGPAAASNNIVAWNLVHHIGAKADGDGPTLSDMGGIYTLGKQPGTQIINNLWHDISGIRYGGWGIYLDEGSSGITVASNLVYTTTHGGFHQHYGETNLIKNNKFAFGRDQQLQFSKREEHESFSFVTNIVFFEQGQLLNGEWLNGKITMDWNLYFDTRISNPAWFNVLGQTAFHTWQEHHDQHSLVEDPGFVDSKGMNWKLKPDSPAFKLGFKDFDLSAAGANWADTGRLAMP
jgi:hypothetical protein